MSKTVILKITKNLVKHTSEVIQNNITSFRDKLPIKQLTDKILLGVKLSLITNKSETYISGRPGA